MNYTNHYRLPQWEKSDRILMDDFNQAMHTLDEGLADAVDKAAQAAGAASAAAASAQSAADSALSKVNNAFSPDYMPYAVGSYVGRGEDGPIKIHLGFKPSFAIISSQRALPVASSATTATQGVAVVGPNDGLDELVQFTSTGMTINYDFLQHPHLNSINTKYCYIAFR